MATLRSMRLGSQNAENAENPALRGKSANAGPQKPGLRPLTRAALGDIANKGRPAALDAGKANKAVLKPARAGLTKQKATSALNLLPQQGRATR